MNSGTTNDGNMTISLDRRVIQSISVHLTCELYNKSADIPTAAQQMMEHDHQSRQVKAQSGIISSTPI